MRFPIRNKGRFVIGRLWFYARPVLPDGIVYFCRYGRRTDFSTLSSHLMYEEIRINRKQLLLRERIFFRARFVQAKNFTSQALLRRTILLSAPCTTGSS